MEKIGNHVKKAYSFFKNNIISFVVLIILIIITINIWIVYDKIEKIPMEVPTWLLSTSGLLSATAIAFFAAKLFVEHVNTSYV